MTLAGEDRHAALRVRDRGLGVPAAALPFLFQRFYRIPDEPHQQISGLGIGPYVCRKIADRHDGMTA